MALKNVGHMNAGDGETSYAKSSGLQKVVISKVLAYLDETLKQMFAADDIHGFGTKIKSMKMVDLGCSSGPNTLFAIFHIMDTIEKLYQNKNTINSSKLPEFEVLLNDLPDNDFNNLFKFVQGKEKKRRCFVYGLPGSFYDSLFPKESLHFAYSSFSLHWLSQIPEGLENENKENMYMARTSPPEVFEAYSKQYQKDFSKFLRLRGQEMIPGGRMFLTFLGRKVEDPSCEDDNCAHFTLLSRTLVDMVAEGLVNIDDLYSFNLPIYMPYKQQVVTVIQSEGSFNLEKMHVFQVPWDTCDDQDVFFDKTGRGKLVADRVRAVLEPMLAAHFGGSIIDEIFGRYAEHLSEQKSSYNIFISLCRK